jgi:hypothetical protein
MIKFVQHPSAKYPPRTYENASADATIAFAFDFNTPGERLTYDAVKTQGKIYIPIVAQEQNSNLKIKTTATILSDAKATTLNIAGNGFYTIVKYGKYTQEEIDNSVYLFLAQVFNHPSFDTKITLIRSGGQSGFDEAGIKAAVKLGIPALCLCPNGWKFMDGKGETICNEQKFLERFNNVLI